MKKILSLVLSIALVAPYALTPLSATAADGVLTVLINGVPPTGHCIAGPVTVSGTGTTGQQGGNWHLSIGWGDGSATSTEASGITVTPNGKNVGLDGSNNPFSYSSTHTPTGPTTGITVVLYHSQPSGQDGQVIVVNQCVAAPTEGVVIVKKHVINDNGGSVLAPAFTLHIGANTFAGSEDGTDFTLSPGAYTVSEDAKAGYTQDSISCVGNNVTTTNGVVNVVAGKNYVCTVTNNDTPNVAPVAQDKSVITNEDTATSSAVIATDATLPAQTLTYSVVSGPSHGSVTVLPNTTGNFTYTPNANYSGSDSFTYKANDGSADSNTATVSITVNAINDAPVSTASSVSTNEDTAVTANLSATDVDGDSLTFSTTTNPTHGTLTLNSASGQFTYTPDLNYNGPDSFDFKAKDASLFSNVSTVTINVVAVNDTPTITTIADKIVDELSLLSFSASASDVDAGDSVTYSLSTGAVSGMIINPTTGAFTWTPTEAQGPADYTVTVVATDSHAASVSTPVSIHVNEVNVAPVTSDFSDSTHQNMPVTIGLSALTTDSDVPVQSQTYTVVTAPAHGTAVVTLNNVVYTPDLNYTGSDSFTYKANDGVVDSNVSTITITVDDGAPVLGTINDATIPEMAMFNFTLTATDPDSDPYTFAVTSGTATGFSIDSNTGAFTWTPTEAQGPGVYNFNATVTAGASSDSQAFQITVSEVNISPVANDGSVSTPEDAAVSGTLTGSDADLPANTLTFATTTNPTHGTITVFDGAAGTFTYLPEANFFGSDSFKFVVNDGLANSAEATVSITVTSVNDIPTITLKGTDPINLVAGDTFVDPSASSTDVEDGDLDVVITGTVDANTPGTYTLTYTATDKDNATVSITRQVIVTSRPVENTQSLCSDGVDNDGDQLVDLADPDCAAFVPAPTPVPPSGGGGGNGPVNFGFVNGGGSVLGASTIGEVLGASCGLYMNKHIRLGSKKNDAEQVKKLQEFLNKNMGSNIPVTGFYGPMTYGVVKNFQTKYGDEVLKPWGLTTATGLVYLSTIRQINNIECPDIMAQLPALIPWSQNPNAQ